MLSTIIKLIAVLLQGQKAMTEGAKISGAFVFHTQKSNMSEMRLNRLAISNIELEMTSNLSFKILIHDFAEEKVRRYNFV